MTDSAPQQSKAELRVELIREYADHQSVRCNWPKGYDQWKDYGNGFDCACGLVKALREVGLPVEWAGEPPE